MTKPRVTRIFLGGALAIIAGAIAAIAAVWIGIANNVFVMNGEDIAGLRDGAVTWSLLGLGVIGSLAIVAGLSAGLVSWVGALLNVAQLERRTWFVVLLLLGIFNLGVLGMLGYIVAGPDGATRVSPHQAPAPAGA